jgi:Subtilase family
MNRLVGLSAILLVAGLFIALGNSTTRATTGAECSPTIQGVTPSVVFVDQPFTIEGDCLLADDGSVEPILTMGDISLHVISSNSKEILARVPQPPYSDELALSSTSGEDARAQLHVNNWVEPSPKEFRAGEVVVSLNADAKIDELLQRLGGESPSQVFGEWLDQYPDLSNWWQFQTQGDTIQEVRKWAQQPEVKWAEPHISLPMHADSTDPCFTDPTSGSCDSTTYTDGFLATQGDEGQWGFQAIDAESAWSVTQGSSSVRIGIVDSGVDNHVDLRTGAGSSRIVVQRDFTGTGLSPSTQHATALAGISAASSNNSVGIAGVAPGVSINSYKVGLSDGSIIDNWYGALLYAAVDHTNVFNLSFSGQAASQGDYPFSAAAQTAINEAHNAGAVIIASAGNDCVDMDAVFVGPAEFDHVIAVAATDQANRRAHWFQGTPPTSCPGSNYGSAVGISAPGEDIMSLNGITSPLPDCGSHLYCSRSGTSFSAPMVAGAAALLSSEGFFGCETEETLTGHASGGAPISADAISSDPLTGTSGMGAGRLNVDKALNWWGGGPIISATSWPNGAVIHAEGSTTRYSLSGGVKTVVTSYNEHNDQCVPPSVASCIPTGPGLTDDPDGDGLATPCDNCPNWSNASQALPAWTVPAGDPDCDGFASTVAAGGRAAESYLGTVSTQHCANTNTANDEASPDAWGFDFNDDQLAGGQEILAYGPIMNTAVTPSTQRYDVSGDGMISGPDILKFGPVFNMHCV